MKRIIGCILLAVNVTWAATGLDTAKIEQLTGLKGTLNEKEGVFKVSVPRTDVKVSVDEFNMPPFMVLTSWAGFQLGKLGSQFPVSHFAKTPGPVEGLESVSVKTPPRFIQEFQISRHGNYVLVVVPLLAYLEIVENLARYIGLQGPLYHGPESFFCPLEVRRLRRDVEKAKSVELPEKALIGRKVRKKAPLCFDARIHVAQGDHRGSPRDGRSKK